MQCQEEFSQSNIISLIKGLSTDTSHTTFDKMLVKRSVPIRELYKNIYIKKIVFCYIYHSCIYLFILFYW